MGKLKREIQNFGSSSFEPDVVCTVSVISL